MIQAALAFIPKPVFAGIVVVLLLSTVVQSCRVSSLTAENAAYEVAVEQCAETNARNTQAIETIKLVNEQCIADRDADETRHANAVAAWEAERALLTERAEDVRIRNVEVFRDPTCAELAKLDINAICPAYANGLRNRAESYNGIRNGRSTDTGTNPP